MNNKQHSFYVYDSEVISGAGDKRPNITDVPIVLITQEYLRVWEAVRQEPWVEIKCMKNIFGHLKKQIYIYIYIYMYHTIATSLKYLPAYWSCMWVKKLTKAKEMTIKVKEKYPNINI